MMAQPAGLMKKSICHRHHLLRASKPGHQFGRENNFKGLEQGSAKSFLLQNEKRMSLHPNS
jgi:hypothetical protein